MVGVVTGQAGDGYVPVWQGGHTEGQCARRHRRPVPRTGGAVAAPQVSKPPRMAGREAAAARAQWMSERRC